MRARLRPLLPAVILVGSCVVMTGCGGQSPTAPDPSALSLTPGLQLLTLAGFAGSVDPAFPPCTPIGQPPDGTSVNTLVLLAIEGGEWVARSAPGNGTIELRLRPSASSANGYTVVGTMAGTARDIGLMGRDARRQRHPEVDERRCGELRRRDHRPIVGHGRRARQRRDTLQRQPGRVEHLSGDSVVHAAVLTHC